VIKVLLGPQDPKALQALKVLKALKAPMARKVQLVPDLLVLSSLDLLLILASLPAPLALPLLVEALTAEIKPVFDSANLLLPVINTLQLDGKESVVMEVLSLTPSAALLPDMTVTLIQVVIKIKETEAKDRIKFLALQYSL